MGPKKDTKKGALKNENGAAAFNIDDPINTDTWKCVVVMAVEKTFFDSFILKEFTKESINRRRQEVYHIDFDTLVMEILNQFASGELSFKYSFLLNFSAIFQEAVSYVTQKTEIPLHLLVKVVKAILFYMREESLTRIKKIVIGTPDPIKVMAEKETTFGTADPKLTELSKKGDSRLKVRPPSVTKEDTQLLKRGEGAKSDQWIDDAPKNAYFNIYILLSGFYRPDFPLELIKAGVPLHGLFCIDASRSGIKQSSTSLTKFQKRGSDVKCREIGQFWAIFLKILWDPEATPYFRNTIFQVYRLPKLLCDKKKLREFIYREISYLMYDLSDFKRQLNNYLDHLRLWNVALRELEIFEPPLGFDNLPGECLTVPVVLQYVIDSICENEKFPESVLSKNQSSKMSQCEEFEDCSSPLKIGSCETGQSWSEELVERGDFQLLQAYLKTKELDIKFDLSDMSNCDEDSINGTNSIAMCDFRPGECGENMEEALSMSDGIFGSYWKKYQKYVETIYEVDYCLFSFYMTKVNCLYRNENLPARSCSSVKKSSDIESFENVNENYRGKSRFTVTEGSREILRSSPYNNKKISRDFFCPEQLKIVRSEKLEASSALEFGVTPTLKVQNLFTSEIFSSDILKNPFECLRGFVDESLFSNTNGFDFVEFLNKPKLLAKELLYWNNYNCIDHAYSFLDDSIFFVLHNRKDDENILHETFNVGVKTSVGLRDFYDYVVDDEAEWLRNQEELNEIAVFLANKIVESDSFKNIPDSEFWLIESLKYQYIGRVVGEVEANQELRTEYSSMEKVMNKIKLSDLRKLIMKEELDGYDISDMAVQFSGLKTIYYANDCYMTIQLVERLYGDQELGVHVTSDSHTLHLYSYVCPEPHVIDPFTFHISYKNGIIVAFERRFLETIEEIEESVESKTTLKGKKNSSESRERVPTKQIIKMVRDDEYFYNMAASLPNGLFIQEIRKVVEPCYIKQQYLVKVEEIAKLENSRLFLPNGNVVKMMANGTFEILKIDTSIITADLNDLTHDSESEKLTLKKFTAVSGEAQHQVFEDGRVTSVTRVQVFQNTDLETNQVYFRRADGTNYVMATDGTLSVQFKDGTRIGSRVLEEPKEPEPSQESDSFILGNTQPKETETKLEDEFVFVHLEIIAEHPDYATVIYNTLIQQWKILLPYDSTITVDRDGCYSVDIDKQTEVKVQPDFIEMGRYSPDREPLSNFTANLCVFENGTVPSYCWMKDTSGKTFILEGDSNYCFETPCQDGQTQDKSSEEMHESQQSELVVSTDLQTCPLVQTEKNNKLTRDNKYIVVKRNISGVEILHKDDVREQLTELKKGSVVYTLNLPDSENRCFVLITPKPLRTLKKWEVETILPNAKYQTNPSPKTSSTTYGDPPSWMHPFPKKKKKFIVPQPLSCRVFVETKKTDITPTKGAIDNFNYEIEEAPEVKYSIIPPSGAKEFLKKLSNDDQNILKEMYTLSMTSVINERRKLKPVNPEKLEHYLEMSKYYVELREYHKKCIRYHLVPNYFHHPAGMSWLILNDLISKLKYSELKTEEVPTEGATGAKAIPSSPVSEYSYEEIEYNLSVSAGQSFSDLSCRSNLSAHTAPAVMRTGGVCRCRVKAVQPSDSTPAMKFHFPEEIYFEDELKEPSERICNFQEKDIEKIEMEDSGGGKTLWTSLEDLMHLGLV